MNSVLYFKTPRFKRNKWEEKIVNELNCTLYNIVGRHRYYSNDDYLVVVNPKVTMVIMDFANKEAKSKANNILRK